MSGYPQRCSCGSGEWNRVVHDARGIYLTKVCDKCERDKLKAYRPEVLASINYDHNEDIEESR